MKWGVRRYQKKDGSLTKAGEKRVTNAGTLGFPSLDKKRVKYKYPANHRLRTDEHYKEIDKVYSNERQRILNDHELLKKSGYNFSKNPDSDIREHNRDIVTKLVMETPAVKIAEEKGVLRYIDKYADATISDLGLENTAKTKAFVRDYLTSTSVSAKRIIERAEETKTQKPRMTAEEKARKQEQINKTYQEKFDKAVKSGMRDEDIELIELEWVEKIDELDED